VANPEKVRAIQTLQKTLRGKATPRWVDRGELLKWWLETPDGSEVDHIVPFKGITVEGYRVSGLNVPWNLQYLLRADNNAKRNQMRPEDGIVARI
jgi:5-methylcytosine-specific restriction endonuclease McrA